MAARLILYGRSYCHLCSDMANALEPLCIPLDFTFQIVDVDSDSELEALHGEKVPVLMDPDGREICHYFLDLDVLRARLAVK